VAFLTEAKPIRGLINGYSRRGDPNMLEVIDGRKRRKTASELCWAEKSRETFSVTGIAIMCVLLLAASVLA
jgi:hypothetical protein